MQMSSLVYTIGGVKYQRFLHQQHFYFLEVTLFTVWSTLADEIYIIIFLIFATHSIYHSLLQFIRY